MGRNKYVLFFEVGSHSLSLLPATGHPVPLWIAPVAEGAHYDVASYFRLLLLVLLEATRNSLLDCIIFQRIEDKKMTVIPLTEILSRKIDVDLSSSSSEVTFRHRQCKQQRKKIKDCKSRTF